MRPCSRFVVAALSAVAAALVVVLPLLLFTTGATAVVPASFYALRSRAVSTMTATTKSVSDVKEAASGLSKASTDWAKALKKVIDQKPWNLTEIHRAAARKIAETVSWVLEDALVWSLVAFGGVAALVGPANLLGAGVHLLLAGRLWVRAVWRRYQMGIRVRIWWRRGFLGLLGTRMFTSVRWKRYGPGKTLGGEQDREKKELREWMRAGDNYLALAPMQ